jgi:hypothetical protein
MIVVQLSLSLAHAPIMRLSLFATTRKSDTNTTQCKQCYGKLKHRFSFSESFSTLRGMAGVRVGDKYATPIHAGLFFGTHKLCFFSPCQNVCDPLVFTFVMHHCQTNVFSNTFQALSLRLFYT